MALNLTPSTFPSFQPYPRNSPKFPSTPFLFRSRQTKTQSPVVTLTAPRASLPQHEQMEEARTSNNEEEEEEEVDEEKEIKWGKVSAVLFDMDGVLCDSEEPSRMAAVDVFAEMGVSVTTDDFVPFMGTGPSDGEEDWRWTEQGGMHYSDCEKPVLWSTYLLFCYYGINVSVISLQSEANFLGGVASVKGMTGFDPDKAKKRFFEIYLDKYAKPDSGIGFPGALELVMQCKHSGLKVAVASSADRIKVDANLAAAGLPISIFDAIVSADAFENLKPAPDIFLAASKKLNIHPSECIVIEDALAGVQAAKSANMRCIAVTTTLSEGKMQQAGPSFIRKNIGEVSIDDILHGGCPIAYNKKVQNLEKINSLEHTSSELLNKNASTEMARDMKSSSEEVNFLGWLQGSRRDIIRYGSLGISVSCLLFTITNWKAMQYASVKGIINLFSGAKSPKLGQNEGESQSSRVQQLKSYLSDLEDRGSASDVPEFPSKLDWLNSAPLKFQKELKGKVVLLDFWTYCCINCMHVLPDLEFLEKKYADKPFTVVGVHSAKFDNEKELEAIRNAVLRYNITHPVVNDGDMYLWRELGVNSWPTFVVVGPNGKLIAQISGEGHRKDLDDLIDAALQYYGEKKLLENAPIPFALEKDNDPRLLSSPLKFPGKLAIDVLNNRLFISDSNHNRIVVIDLEGNFIVQVGSNGEEGLVDGSFDDASFTRPQGLAYNPKKNLLYVADTENHALREIDFVNETVRTLAGNGTKGSDYKGGGKGTAQVLNSPWDVCYEPSNEIVYIAMAGQHQIWEHNTVDGVTRSFSGDGFERNLNGSSSTNTSFAQPSGISLSSDFRVYVADSESSSIRTLDLKTGGSRLLAGGDPLFAENLFRYGDKDGIGSDALLQHPLGILCGKDGQIYVADSYNHKIKRLDPISRKVITLAGTGYAGFKDGFAQSAQLSEPSGLIEVGSGRFLIADTNNNVIRSLDLNEKEPVLSTLELKGAQPPSSKRKSLKRLRRRLSADAKIITANGGSSAEGYLYLAISVPDGYHFSKEAQSKFDVEVDPADAVYIEPSKGVINLEGSASLRFKRASSLPATGRINCKVYYCKEDEVCLYESLAFNVSFQQDVKDSEPGKISLTYTVTPKLPSGTSLLVLTN